MPEDLPRLQQAPLVLRAFAAKDLQLIQDVSSDPLIPMITSVPSVPSTPDASAAQVFITRQLARLRNGEGYSFAIADSTTDEAFGQIGLWLANLAQGRASIGYWVADRHRGQGVASRALGMISTWGLGLPGAHRLELYVEPWNSPPETTLGSPPDAKITPTRRRRRHQHRTPPPHESARLRTSPAPCFEKWDRIRSAIPASSTIK